MCVVLYPSDFHWGFLFYALDFNKKGLYLYKLKTKIWELIFTEFHQKKK